MHISDGENLIKNPNEEWGAVLEFLGLKRIEFKLEHISYVTYGLGLYFWDSKLE